MKKSLIIALLCTLLMSPAVHCAAQVGDFRIESKVYLGGEDEPQTLARNLTLFHAEKIYDFSLGTETETAILDLSAREFRLIDTSNRITTTLDAQLLDRFLADLLQRAQEAPSPLTRFLADPEFEETFDSQELHLTLAAKTATYRVQGEVQEDPSLAARYAQFADWYAKVNSTRPRSFPPAARLELNRRLKDHELVPVEVQFDYRRDDGEQVTLHSTHIYQWSLDKDDFERIDQALEQAGSLEEVPPEKYHQLQRR